MALDGAFLHCIQTELQSAIVGSRIDKIYQPSREELVLILRTYRETKKLYLSARANSPRIHFTQFAPENPQSPPMFCMLLRKRLTGAKLVGIRQPGLERILFLDFEAQNEWGDPIVLRFAVEIMARHSNIILMEEDGTIIDAVKRIDSTMSSVRLIHPGLPYQLPPAQDKLDLLLEPAAAIETKLEALPNMRLHKALQQVLQGISPLVAREIALQAAGDEDAASHALTRGQKNNLIAFLEGLKARLTEEKAKPVLLLDAAGKPMDFSYLPVTQYGQAATAVEHPTFSALLDAFYSERDRLERMKQRSAALTKLTANAYERVIRKLEAQRAELQQCEDRATLRMYADLINANLYALRKGAPFYDLPNYYDENKTLRVPANPALSPSQNAQRYYKEYHKTFNKEKMLKQMLAQGEEELLYLESVLDMLSRAQQDRELQAIREELAAQGYVKLAQGKKKTPNAALPPLQYRSADGYPILVGRNNKQNDQLSLHTADKTDLWFHAKNMPGAHVILRVQAQAVPDATLLEAAILAAFYSKGSGSQKVPVDYTLVKNVKKPAGAKPGRVIYDHYQTLFVDPTASRPKQE